LAFWLRRGTTWATLSCAIVKTTVTGSRCVITATVAAAAAPTTLPRSTRRTPTRPQIDAVMWQKSTCN
jgi:hypothetical protein